jgi:hypothetical protein
MKKRESETKRKIAYSLEKIVNNALRLDQIPKDGLQAGDKVLITTQNSVYSIHVLENGVYQVSGGWFDKNGVSPMTITINGCTWGGKIIKKDIIAALGLCLEFGNRLVTSPIQKACVIPFKY